jgi:hypothetical protein
MKTYKQFTEELSPNFIKMPQIISADRTQHYITGPNGKPKKISEPAHRTNFNTKNQNNENL